MPKARFLDEYKDSYGEELEKYFADNEDCIVCGFDKFEKPIAYMKPTGAPSLIKWAASRHFSEKTINEWREAHPAFAAACDRALIYEKALLTRMGQLNVCPKHVELEYKRLGMLTDEKKQGALPAVNISIDANSLKYADVKDINAEKIVAMIEDVQKTEEAEIEKEEAKNDSTEGQ